jgi:hypothetical protein
MGTEEDEKEELVGLGRLGPGRAPCPEAALVLGLRFV